MKGKIRFEGTYLDNKKVDGKLTWPDGKVYVGPFVNGKPEGIGESTNDQGILQRAEWKNGRKVRFL